MLDVDHNKKVSSDTEQIEEFIQKPKHPCFVCCVCKARFGHMQILHVHMKLGKCKESANEDDNDVLPIDEGMWFFILFVNKPYFLYIFSSFFT